MSDPVVIPPVPTPVPTAMDPESFDTRADALLSALPGIVTAMNAQNVQNNTLNDEVTGARDEAMAAGLANAASNAATATAQATAALGSANAAAASASTAAAQAAAAAASATSAGTAATAAAATLISAVTARPTVKAAVSVDWTLKPTAAALTAAGWTVSRTGELTSMGLPAKALENQFVHSQGMTDAAWVKTAASVAAVTDESGLGGVALTAAVGAGVHACGQVATLVNVASSAQYRIRFLCKAAGYTKAIIADRSTGRAAAAFDLAAGSPIASTFGPGYVSHGVTAHELGGGLYWCELVATSPAGGTGWEPTIIGYPDAGATLAATGANYTGDGSSGIEVYAAQLQQGIDSAYVPTTSDRIAVFEPALVTAAANELSYQHTDRGECAGLVQYPADTNLCLQSQALDQSPWGGANVSATQSKRRWAAAANFWRLAKTSAVAGESRSQTVTTSVAAGSRYSLTVALLGDRWSGVTSASVGLEGVANGGFGVNGDSVAAVISGPGAIAQVVGSLWNVTGLSYDTPTLVRVTRTWPLAETAITLRLYPFSSTSTVSGAAVLATRIHLSATPRLMPYIPTTSAAVTRGAQTVSLGGAGYLAASNPAEGTLVARASVEDVVWDQSRILLSVGAATTGSNRCAIEMQNSVTGRLMGYVVAAGTAQAMLTSVVTEASAVPATFAFSFRRDNFQYSAQGQTTAADSAGVLPVSSALLVGQSWAGLIQRSELYPRAMSAAELAAITTPGVLP